MRGFADIYGLKGSPLDLNFSPGIFERGYMRVRRYFSLVLSVFSVSSDFLSYGAHPLAIAYIFFPFSGPWSATP